MSSPDFAAWNMLAPLDLDANFNEGRKMFTEADANMLAAKLAAATGRVVQDYGTGDVVHEEPFSDQLCGRLKETLTNFETPNVHWQADVASRQKKGRARLRARTLTKVKEEPTFGADLVIVLDIDTPNYAVRKGFLAQAKRLENGQILNMKQYQDLMDQCEKMLEITPASMIFLYGADGVHVVPATAAMSLRHRDLWAITTYEIGTLYRDFAICRFGDTRIQATDPRSLEGLRTLAGASAAARLIGRHRHEPDEL